MKKIILTFLLFFSFNAFAAPVDKEKDLISLQFSEIVFPDLLKVIYSDVLKRSYVIDTNVLNSQDVLTMHITKKSAADIEKYILALLDARDLSVIRKGSIDIITKKPDAVDKNKEAFVYRPKFRSVSYLIDIATAFFPRGGFSGQRAIQPNFSPSAQAQGQSQQSDASLRNASSSDSVISRQGQNQTGSVRQQNAQNAQFSNSFSSSFAQNQQDVIAFFGEVEDIKRLTELLVQIDTPSAEILVKAMVYEVRTEQSEGSAMSLVASILEGKFSVGIDGGSILSNSLKIKFNNFDAVYSLLSGDKRFKLVSSPMLRVISGASAKFIVGNEVPVLGAVTYPNSGQSVQNVDYKPSGVILTLKPHVREDTTDLEIFQQISSFVPTSTGVNQSPTLLKRELQTQVSAKADEMILLSGLEETQTNDNNQGLSFLPSFFRANSNSELKTELILIMQLTRI